ncbi:type III effector protein (plasmid) [Streptomyces genisteinicus]|uniref:Type III effector protein n=1 Tax=Streptomyces genisteinicus TaxID=2768068 RepID=A0A7H0I5D4_9ACTN|nr:type III effector protein [Streptomyces genisteinicus]QNP68000.1 type III effector protein [Streptomyces genisteinicus]
MTAAERPSPTRADAHSPASFLAAAAALAAVDDALRDAQHERADASRPGPEQALASLMLLRQVREQLAGWETGLIETARDAGASWADLARPLGVASRQAAERRYLRGRPGPAGATGEQRVTATRQARAAERATATWARAHAAALRSLAGQITALPDLPTAARRPLGELHTALAHDDPADLIAPLAATRPHLATNHPDLAAQLDSLTPPDLSTA